MTPAGIFNGMVDFFKSLLPWSKTRVLFEKLKKDPTNADLTQQVHDLYQNDLDPRLLAASEIPSIQGRLRAFVHYVLYFLELAKLSPYRNRRDIASVRTSIAP